MSFRAIADFGEWFVPFGFIYDGAYLFWVWPSLSRRVISFVRFAGNPRLMNLTPSVKQVLAVSCNPFTYLACERKIRARRVQTYSAAQGASTWIFSIRDALRVGGRQGAEFAVTLATIEVVVQVLTITGVGNKFAFMIEALCPGLYVCSASAAGGGCAYYIGLDGFFVALAAHCGLLCDFGHGNADYGCLCVACYSGWTRAYQARWAGTHTYLWCGMDVKEFVASKGDRVAAHMFIFYFAILSAITPPVAIASLVGAKLAGATYFKTSMMSLRFAIVGFIVPFLFMFDPALLTFGHPARVALSASMTLLGFVAFSAGTQGWLLDRLHGYERILLFVCFVSLILFVIFFSFAMLATGLVCGGIPLVRQIRDRGASAGQEGRLNA